MGTTSQRSVSSLNIRWPTYPAAPVMTTRRLAIGPSPFGPPGAAAPNYGCPTVARQRRRVEGCAGTERTVVGSLMSRRWVVRLVAGDGLPGGDVFAQGTIESLGETPRG